ncbi:MAG: hypothetical protein ACKOAK_06500, partial [Ignavibacteria bacterium]
MRYFLVLLCSMFVMEVGFELKAQSFDAKTFIQHETASKLPAMLKQSVHSFTLDRTIAGTIFGSQSKDLQITNFPIGMNLNGTVNLTISPSVIDANTIIMIGNTRVPVPMITTYQGSISGEQGSTVLITYAQGELYGWVSRANGTTVSFAPENVQSDIKKEHVMYNENSL